MFVGRKGNLFLKNRRCRDERGFSIAELMISVGISSLIAIQMASVSDMQIKTVKWFEQKIDIQDLKMLISSRLSQKDVCSSNLTPGGYPISINTSNPSSTNISLPALYYLDSSGPAMVVAGQRIPKAGNPIVVSKIYFTGVSRVSSTSNEYSGKIIISFDAKTVLRAVSPISIPLTILTDGNGVFKVCSSLDEIGFQGLEVENSPTYRITGYRSSTSNVDISNLNQGYSLIEIHAWCKCWDDGGGEWSKVTVQFLDSGGSNTNLLSMQACFENSAGDDETGSMANFDTNILVLPKLGGNIRTLRFIFDRSTTSCSSWAYYKTLR